MPRKENRSLSRSFLLRTQERGGPSSRAQPCGATVPLRAGASRPSPRSPASCPSRSLRQAPAAALHRTSPCPAVLATPTPIRVMLMLFSRRLSLHLSPYLDPPDCSGSARLVPPRGDGTVFRFSTPAVPTISFAPYPHPASFCLYLTFI